MKWKAKPMADKTITDERLDRIESKIDKLSEIVITLARAEEKLIALEEDKKILMDRMLKIEDRVLVNEKKTDENSMTISVINKVFWITLTAIVGVYIGSYFITRLE
jgi:hypothetical protein